jgi:hypothetical protein
VLGRRRDFDKENLIREFPFACYIGRRNNFERHAK